MQRKGSGDLAQVVSQDHLILQRRQWKDNGQCVVFAAGCFDLLHPGHVRLLEQARSYGDILVVGVQGDASVRSAHRNGSAPSSEHLAPGPQRPVTPADERAEILAALAAVDYVVEFEGPSPDDLLAHLQPDIIVRGTSSTPNAGDITADTAGAPAAQTAGVKIVRILLEPGYSTTRLLERITQTGA